MSEHHHWIQTNSGGRFFFDETDGESDISVIDIARSLSRIMRFGGHATAALSVAEHSVAVAEIVQTEGGTERQQLYALMHDAHEAYLGDLVSPLKRFLKEKCHADLGGLQNEVQRRILKALDIPPPEPSEMVLVEKADLWALTAERRLYMPGNHVWYLDGVEVPEYVEGIYGAWGDDEARRIFEKNYDRLRSSVGFESRVPIE